MLLLYNNIYVSRNLIAVLLHKKKNNKNLFAGFFVYHKSYSSDIDLRDIIFAVALFHSTILYLCSIHNIILYYYTYRYVGIYA